MGLPWEELTPEEKVNHKKGHENNPERIQDMIRYPEQQLIFPRPFLKIEDQIKNLELRDDDIWLVTFPKCGTTWMQETLTMLVNDMDQEYGKIPLHLRSPFLEIGAVMDRKKVPHDKVFEGEEGLSEEAKVLRNHLKNGGQINLANNLTGRRVIKSHLSFDFLPEKMLEKCKVIYVARDPKDVAVSWFHHHHNLHGYGLSFSEFVVDFMKGLTVYGSYPAHLKSAWARKDHPNLKIFWYEDMKKDFRIIADDLTKFLDHPLSQAKVEELCKHVSFDSMRNNPSTNPTGRKKQTEENKSFFRKGTVGDWKNHFSEEEETTFKAWIKENIEDAGITLPK